MAFRQAAIAPSTMRSENAINAIDHGWVEDGPALSQCHTVSPAQAGEPIRQGSPSGPPP